MVFYFEGDEKMINTEKLPLLETSAHINYNGINNSNMSINHNDSSSTESIITLDDDQITNGRENNNLNSLLFDGDSVNTIVNFSNDWRDTDDRYGGKTQKRLDINGNWEYNTKFITGDILNEKIANIDNQLYLMKEIILNDGRVILELSNLNENKKIETKYKIYNNEEEREYNNNLNDLDLTTFLPINKEKPNFLKKFFSSKYMFLPNTFFLNFAFGSVLLFEAKNYFHKEKLPENLYHNFWDVLMSGISGITVMNLSYLNYKLISLKNKWKYLSFSLVIGGISIWDQFLYLYVSEENFNFISFIERISIFFISILIEELIFDKIAQPCIEKLWQNLKNQNFSKIIKYGSTVSMLLFVSIFKNILTGLYGEEKEINLENIKKALPLTLLTVILENTVTSFSFSYFDWFWTKISIAKEIATNSIKGIERFANQQAQNYSFKKLIKQFNFQPFNANLINESESIDHPDSNQPSIQVM